MDFSDLRAFLIGSWLLLFVTSKKGRAICCPCHLDFNEGNIKASYRYIANLRLVRNNDIAGITTVTPSTDIADIIYFRKHGKPMLVGENLHV